MRRSSSSSTALSSASVKTRTFIGPFIILIGVVLSSAIQTEVASYEASTLGFDKPYFSFFVTHSTFVIVFPIHLALVALKGGPKGSVTRARQLVRGLRAVLADQLSTVPRWRVLAKPFMYKIVPLTVLVTIPAVCWFAAMALAPAVDITALYATSAFHTYFFSMLLLGTRLTRTTLGAIAVAFAGVLAITLDSGSGDGNMGSNRLLGDIIMVVGGAALGLYEVVYKMVLPESEGGTNRSGQTETHDAESSGSDEEDNEIVLSSSRPMATTPLLSGSKPPSENGSLSDVQPISSRVNSPRTSLNGPRPHSYSTHAHTPLRPREVHHHVPSLPSGLHSNFLVSAIGLATFVLLWFPLPLLHMTGMEIFELPTTAKLWGIVAVVALCGSIYNAGLMMLIGLWGPTTSSVANLLTIGLVAIADALWMGRAPDFQTIIGAGMICGGFAVLLYDGEE